jgi:hypothetical protein
MQTNKKHTLIITNMNNHEIDTKDKNDPITNKFIS